MPNVKVTVDASDVRFEWTDEEPRNDGGTCSVHRSLAEAKRQALTEATPERDAWARCVRNIRNATHETVL